MEKMSHMTQIRNNTRDLKGRKKSSNKIILHHYSVSRTGCICCRKRKKKCDENYPTCNACKKRKVECQWNSEKNPLTKEKSYMEKLRLNKRPSQKSGTKSTVKSEPRQIKGIEEHVDDEKQKIQTTESNVASSAMRENENSQENIFFDGVGDSLAHLETIGTLDGELTSIDQSLMVDLSNYMGRQDTPDIDDTVMDIINDTQFLAAFSNSSLVGDGELKIQRLIDIAHKIISEQRLPLKSNILYQIQTYLDDRGVTFLENYVFNVSKILGLASEELNSNYFLKTFFSVATSNEAILLALASWGGSFLQDSDGSNKAKSTGYMIKACKLMENTLVKPHLDRFECYNVLCFYLIYIGNLICGGDVKGWYILIERCFGILKHLGGIESFLASFNYSNDAKWIISDLQSHDIMSSISFNDGTYHSHLEYVRILDDDFYSSYGIDPLQGCSQPLFLLLTEIINTRKEIKENLKSIDALSKYELNDVQSYRDNRNKRLCLLERNEQIYQELTERVKACTPNESQFSMLIYNKKNFEIQMSLFELFSFVCQIIIELNIKGESPSSTNIQLLLLRALNTLDVIIDAGTIGIVPLPMLMCGICCCTVHERMEMRLRFERALSVYNIGNLHRVWEIVQLVWSKNDCGNINLNWAEIAKEKGWDIYVG